MIATLAVLLAVVTAPYTPPSYACDGSTTSYTINFPYQEFQDVVATTTTAAGVVTLLTINTDYTLSVIATQTTGLLVLTAGSKCPTGSTLKITRSTALTQPTSFRQQTKYSPGLHETEYDRLMEQVQEAVSSIANPVLPSVLINSTLVTATGGSTALTLANWFKDPCNVKTFGAVGDGFNDDTTAVQAAINSCGSVYLPFGKYKVSATLLIDDRQGMVIAGDNMRGSNNGGTLTGSLIQWVGNSTDPVIKVYGSAFTSIRDIKILASTAFPVDTGIRFETKVSRVNTHNDLRNVFVTSDGILGSLHYAVRYVAGSGGDANNDQSTLDHLTIGGYDTAGVDISHAQSVDHRFFNLIMGSNLGASTYGVTASTGATFSVYGGGGGGHFGADFNVLGTAFTPITISDFHSEGSAHFLITQGGTPTNSAGPVTLIGCSATDSSVAANGRVIDFETQGPLNIINFASNFSVAKNKSIYYNATGLDTYGFSIIGLFFTTSATNAFSNFQPTFMTGVEVVNAGGVTGQRAKSITSENLLTYSASIATDAGIGSSFRIDPTNGTAFTLTFPTNGVKGQRLQYCIRNISGGALGVITWTSFKMAAFVNPANGFNRCIEFKFDGFNYYEINRTTTDVPN